MPSGKKKEREQKSRHTNVRKEQEQTDIRKSKLSLTFSLLLQRFKKFIDKKFKHFIQAKSPVLLF